MTETNDIGFIEPVEPEPVETRRVAPNGSGGRGRPSTSVRIGIVAGTALLVVLGAAVAMGASPAPSTAPGASAAPDASAVPGAGAVPGPNGVDKDGDHAFGMPGFGMRGGDFDGGFHDITIASISGSNLSLKTADGWTRTITPTSTTTITKAGATIAVSDLEVGDQIAFSQTKQADGTYTIDAIRVILPSVGGQVSAVSGDTITVTQRDGTSATIHVDSATTYQVEGVTSGDALRHQGRQLRRGPGHTPDRRLPRRRHRRQRVPRRSRHGWPRPRHGAGLGQRRRRAERLPRNDHPGLTSGPLTRSMPDAARLPSGPRRVRASGCDHSVRPRRSRLSTLFASGSPSGRPWSSSRRRDMWSTKPPSSRSTRTSGASQDSVARSQQPEVGASAGKGTFVDSGEGLLECPPRRHSSAVEQLFRKQQVLGSNPSVGSTPPFRAQEDLLSRLPDRSGGPRTGHNTRGVGRPANWTRWSSPRARAWSASVWVPCVTGRVKTCCLARSKRIVVRASLSIR